MEKIKNYIMYLFLTPAKTQEVIEAKRKEFKKLKKVFLFIALGGLLLMALLSCFKSMSTGTASGISTPIVCIGALGFVLINHNLKLLDRQEEVYKKLNCPECSSRVAFDENVCFDVLDSFEKYKRTVENGNVKTDQTFYSKLLISCKCQKCGHIHQFEETFRTERYVNAECKYSYNISDLVKDYFMGKAQFDNK